MPTTDALIISAIILAFIVFGAVLAWADYQTRNLRRADRSVVAQIGKNAGATTTVQSQTARRRELNAIVH